MMQPPWEAVWQFLTVVMVAWPNDNTKNQQITHSKQVDCTVWELYLNKMLKIKRFLEFNELNKKIK